MLKKAITITGLVFISTLGFSQTTEQLKKENQKLKSENEKLKLSNNDLKAKVDFCTSIEKNKNIEVRSFADFYDIKVIKCKGNKTDQNFKLELLITQSRVNQWFIYSSYLFKSLNLAFDDIGNKYKVTRIEDPLKEHASTKILTNIPMKLTVTISDVMPGLSSLKTVNLEVESESYSSHEMKVSGMIIINNLPIEW